MPYKVFDTHSLRLLERMEDRSHLAFSEKEYAQIYADRHVSQSLVVVKDTMQPDIKSELEKNYGRLHYVEDKEDGYFAIAKSRDDDSYSLINIKKEPDRYITQAKHMDTKGEAFELLSNTRDKEIKPVINEHELAADKGIER